MAEILGIFLSTDAENNQAKSGMLVKAVAIADVLQQPRAIIRFVLEYV